MSITVTYYRLPAAERENVTRDQNTWRQFERKLGKAHHAAFMSSIADMDKGGGTREEQFARLASLMKERSDPKQFNVEKDWQSLGYLLTGKAEIGKAHVPGETLYNVIYGGLDTGATSGYGPVQYFDDALVAESADALVKADGHEINLRFNPTRMAQLGIYAAPEERERQAILGVIERLALFFQTAVTNKENVIKFSS